jgi:hypothetical protein
MHPLRSTRHARIAALASVGIAAGLIASASAQEPARTLPLSSPDKAAREVASQRPECTCRAGGVSHQLGTQICLGTKLVRCAMDLNVTSWQAVDAPCPES